MATILRQLWALPGTISLPGSGGPVSVPVWGFGAGSGQTSVPGPALEATVGDLLRVRLNNRLPEPVSVIFPGQSYSPDPVRDSAGRFVSYARQAPANGTRTYEFRLTRPGTFRYESGSSPGRQVQMGLGGALIARPAGYNPAVADTWTAYGPDTGSDYDLEQLLILGEVDSALHAAVAAGNPVNLLEYRPDAWTLNGRSYAQTLDPNDESTQPMGAAITVQVGQRLLLRCVNLGFLPHSLHFGGLEGRVVGEDGFPQRTAAADRTCRQFTLQIPPGKTFDVMLEPGQPGDYYLFDRSLLGSHEDGRFGGMVTRLTVVP